ncbi:GmrSD restriction endonuclease domain-containing protein [Brachybacterium nesterenkovii]|uniref:GmrSD restriction endonuclease domain-containing protein n=1 Tax=Brachybacterium nesterenkovii TaxID=47847 RepID=UPI00321B2B0E
MSTFQTPMYTVADLLARAADGRLQLPDFQRPYRWDDERIRSLLVTILRGHPMGVIMTLETGGENVRFKPRTLTGARVQGRSVEPELLLLDGQQRMTSMFQALTGDGVVDTEDERHHKLRRRYFIDVEKALGDPREQDEAIRSLPEDGVVRSNFNRDIDLDVSTPEKQQAAGLMPLSTLFDKDQGSNWIWDFADLSEERRKIGRCFSTEIMQPMQGYQVPAIQLTKDISKEAVATVFEKVNTGGLPLDTFELLTATFAGDRAYFEETGEDFRLGEDWELTRTVIDQHRVLHGIRNTDVLMGISVLVTLAKRNSVLAAGATGKKVPATSARREDILNMPLADYRAFSPRFREALPAVARHMRSLHIHRKEDVPYRSQLIALTAFHVLLGDRAEENAVRAKLNQWFWCGVLGEQYGATIETKLARDVEQVPGWATGESPDIPDTVTRATFAESRLGSLRTRNSAAYKGIYALVMGQERPTKDWMFDRELDLTSYDELQVDIHHVFPYDWCNKNGIDANQRESIINKTPLAKKTNIRLSGDSPAVYMPRIDAKNPSSEHVDATIGTHAIDPAFLRAGDFEGFFKDRRCRLVELVESAMGKAVARDWGDESADSDMPENFVESLEVSDAFEE